MFAVARSARVCLVVAALAPAAATGAHAQGTVPLAARIRAELGKAWGLPPAAVRLAWLGVTDTAAEVQGDVRLTEGSSGSYAAVVNNGSRVRGVLFRAGTVQQAERATHAIPAFQVVSSDLVATDTVVIWGDPTKQAAPVTAVGRVARHRILNGAVLRETDTMPAPVIHRGDVVRMVSHRGDVLVEVDAVALADAPDGGAVTVRAGAPGSLAVRGVARAGGVVDVTRAAAMSAAYSPRGAYSSRSEP